MDLILQGTDVEIYGAQRLAALAGSNHITPIAAGVYRCEGASEPADKIGFARACYEAQFDYAFRDGRTLADFKLLAMDMDSTFINIECIDEIADMQGLKPQVSEITEMAMRGELDFSESLRRRVALLRGLDSSALEKVYEERLRLNPGAQMLVDAAKAAGLKTLLVSGGFTFFTDRLKVRCGFDHTRSNLMEIIDGKLTGHVTGDIVDAEQKRSAVEEACGCGGFSCSQAIVIGDGANDLNMMGIAGLSVAYHAKPVVRQKADVALNFVGLDGLLHILDSYPANVED